MLLDHCYCPYICTILKYVHHFANIAYYLEYEAKDNMICGVEQCANHINASRRQLQRILKELVDEGIIVKVKKGIYVKQSCI